MGDAEARTTKLETWVAGLLKIRTREPKWVRWREEFATEAEAAEWLRIQLQAMGLKYLVGGRWRGSFADGANQFGGATLGIQ